MAVDSLLVLFSLLEKKSVGPKFDAVRDTLLEVDAETPVVEMVVVAVFDGQGNS